MAKSPWVVWRSRKSAITSLITSWSSVDGEPTFGDEPFWDGDDTDLPFLDWVTFVLLDLREREPVVDLLAIFVLQSFRY